MRTCHPANDHPDPTLFQNEAANFVIAIHQHMPCGLLMKIA
jgi:hypothetical protein